MQTKENTDADKIYTHETNTHARYGQSKKRKNSL